MAERKWFRVDPARAAAEVAIIVTGVLIALAVDSLVEAREERALERQYLERIAADLVADSAEFDYQIGIERERGEQARMILAAVSTAPKDATELLRAIEQAGWFSPLSLAPHTFQEPESTGNLRLIRSTHLRNALSKYYYQAIGNRDAVYGYAIDRAWPSAKYTALTEVRAELAR